MAAITITEIQLFNVLKKKLGEQEAEQLVGFVQSEIKEEVKRKSETLATKEDLSEIKGSLETKLAQMESKLILWAFVFWATQLGAMFAFLKLFIAK
ncbi:hypothetical protein ACFOW1_11085 [Parasediminibacterium paludis]|jgi:hypothetical protein|uniref:DUF1640 domain-containing protein n=1 Tax=Parasediminibacterium paludis TaxID=908966 RepID=A0ABV8PZL0_9BACT